jgi:hypothetical protein
VNTKNEEFNGKLSQETFFMGMEFLNSYYIRFNYFIKKGEESIPNQQMIRNRVWYSALKHFDNETFMDVVQRYCKANEYPPQSPMDLLNVVRKSLELTYETPNEAWNLFIEMANDRKYQSYSPSVGTMIEIEAIIENTQNKALKNTIKAFEHQFRVLRNIDEYAKNQFIKEYIEQLSKLLQRNIENVETLLPNTKNNNLLGNKDLKK